MRPDTTNPLQPVIVAARRTPIGTAGHALSAFTVDALAAPVLRAVTAQSAELNLPIEDVILGNCLGPGGNLARIAALRAGLDQTVPGVTVDRQCGSGLDALMQAASRIRAGDAELVLAGGAESASTAPKRSWPNTDDAYARAPFTPAGFPDPEMGTAAEALASRLSISRQRQDAWAARSHRRTVQAQRAGVFDREMVAVEMLAQDERPRDGLDELRLSRLRPAFDPAGTVTAGNSCGVSDGAAAAAITSYARWSASSMPGLMILGCSVVGCDPALPGLGPVPAVRKLLQRRGLRISDIGAIEITEAFAAQVIAACDLLGLDENIVCSDGGAIAMGHPWGASGAVLVVRLFHRMLQPDGPEFGVAACAIGGGQGIAMLVRKVNP